MNSNFNEDEILTMLNDIEITEDELSNEDLTEIEKKKLSKNILNSVKIKKLKIKKTIIASSIAGLMILSVPLVNSNAFADITSKLSIIPGIGQVTIDNNKGLVLKNSLEVNSVTLKNLYMDNTKLVATIHLNSSEDYQCANYYLKTADGITYKLKVTDASYDESIPNSFSATYKLEYNGFIEKSSKYTLGVINDKATFSLTNNNFKEAFPSGILYTATNGKTTLNITSVKKDKNILRVYYYFTDKFNKNTTNQDPSISFNIGTFKDEEQINSTKGSIESSIDNPHFQLSDEFNNVDYGHDDSAQLSYENVSSFNLDKLKGSKLKLSIPSITYTTGNIKSLEEFKKNNDFNISLNVPKSGKTILNEVHEYKGFKFKIISIERLSDKKISLVYTVLNDENSKLKTLDVQLGSTSCDGGSSDATTNNVISVLPSNNIIGDKIDIDTINIRFASVGPFNTNINLNNIKH
ncbi:hypothetical protein [Clostridium hydrogenum]|uniref:hypothetical protein n=1 Tax=Clostridium hydrogenum TaxID=2855764 RepID=UPI001F31020C|nr:hypothetical protein [Clostridium hydrogenum]